MSVLKVQTLDVAPQRRT